MKDGLSFFLVTIVILSMLALLSTTVINGCSKHSENKAQSIKLASYDGKFYWVDEGTSLKNYPIGPDILRVDYSPTTSTENLFLHSLTSERSEMLNLQEFENFINSGTVREATENEKKNAELYKDKFEEGESLTSVKMKGFTLKVGDLADNVFQVLTPDMEISEPIVMRDINDEIIYVLHKYSVNGIEYTLNFMRREQNLSRRCYSCPYRLNWIVVSRYKSLTFKEYMKKYWEEQGKRKEQSKPHNGIHAGGAATKTAPVAKDKTSKDKTSDQELQEEYERDEREQINRLRKSIN